mgnify:CR=1 FL=1
MSSTAMHHAFKLQLMLLAVLLIGAVSKRILLISK